MKWFDYAAPRTLPDALSAYAANPGARLLAGGTDLLVQMRSGRKETDQIIDLKRVPELNELAFDAIHGLTLGSAVPCRRIYEDKEVSRAFPALAEVAGLIGGTQIQSRASIGGNLCNAAPSADSIPLLIALQTTCRIAGPQGERTIAVEDFCTAPGKNVLGTGELLISLQIPPLPAQSAAHYIRFIPRNEMDIAVVGAGVCVEFSGGTIRSARVALASVAPTPIFVREAGEALANGESVQRAAELAGAAARPINDMRGTMDYRRHLCEVLTRRALEAAIARAKESH
ncbi:MAG TPA: xanthine dehydrogenase family protein subunit M [Bryobacteraceae bacterium]|nr:xanthine dehydrogenase family protein subunit M [Bryobacteraceae bacterium]